METNLCIYVLRGGEARCNGGAYDGCACGPYTEADKKEIKLRERRVLARERTARRAKQLRSQAAELRSEADRLERIAGL